MALFPIDIAKRIDDALSKLVNVCNEFAIIAIDLRFDSISQEKISGSEVQTIWRPLVQVGQGPSLCQIGSLPGVVRILMSVQVGNHSRELLAKEAQHVVSPMG